MRIEAPNHKHLALKAFWSIVFSKGESKYLSMPGATNKTTIESNQKFVEVCGYNFLTADFSHIEEDLQRTATNGGPCYTVVLLNNKPAVEISESKEVKAISEWFRTESQLPGYLAIAPVVGIAHAMTAHAGATPGTTAVATTDTPIRRRPGRKKGFKVKRTMPGERSLAAGAGG